MTFGGAGDESFSIQSLNDQEELAEATVNRDDDGEAVGVPLFLGVDDLAALGMDPDEIRTVVYGVFDGELRVASKAEVEVDA